MPYQQNPVYSTYHTERFDFVSTPNIRRPTAAFTSMDERFINYFPEKCKSIGKQDNKYYLRQRGGLQYHHSTAVGEARGIYYYNSNIYSVVGNTLYSNSSALQVLSTSTGTVGFQEVAAGATKYLVVLDGTSGWTISTTNVVVQITDVDFPTPHCIHCAYLDGYLCVAKSGTNDIYNSAVNDPFTWTAGDFITAEISPDNVLGICRQTNYIVALGSQTIEYFYDAGNSPGTPFSRNSAALQQIGLAATDTLVVIEDQIMFVGQTQNGGRSVWVMDGFKPRDISTPIIKEIVDNEGSSISSAKAYCVRSKGHKFYVLCLSTGGTWVYDFDEDLWHQWLNYTGASAFPCSYATDNTVSSFPYFQDTTTGQVYNMIETNTLDTTATTSNNITSIVITTKQDFDDINRKFMSRFTLIVDIPTGSTPTYSLEYSDDDYVTWSTARTISISNHMPTTTQLGSFRRRAFRIKYAQAYEMRLGSYEVDINYGSR